MNPPLAKANISLEIGAMPYRMAFAGGWIDQPFISKHNPSPPGSMVVVALNPTFRFMNRCGMGTSTRLAAKKLWGETLPDQDPALLMRELYDAENKGREDPSGSQDMAGIIYPGISRLDYDADVEGGYFPSHVESCNDPTVARWVENMIYCMPVNQRPNGYHPLGKKNLDPDWIQRLGQTGKECYQAIKEMDAEKLGKSMNDTMDCWEHILPDTVRHPTIQLDLLALLRFYQNHSYGAMYSGCGGGYFYIVSDKPVPGTFQVSVRIAQRQASEQKHA